jgi:cell division protein FtsZ
LVDPDANIIWGSAFNNDLQGKIRVSVVATGIDAEAVTHAPPQPAKVFAFPGAARTAEPPKTRLTPPEPMAEAPAAEPAMESDAAMDAEAAPAEALEFEEPAADELTLDAPMAEEASDELLLDSGAMLGDEDGGERFVEEDLAGGPESSAPGTRSWITGDEAPAAPKAGRDGGTLFERMSNIARGAAKAQVEEETPAPGRRRDPLDIPRFLGRQNNQ